MNVIFYSFGKYPYPQLGIGYLVSNLRKNGFNCNFKYLENIQNIDSAAEEISKLKPDIVGLTATSVDYNKIKVLSKKLKENCKPIIFLGGAHISSVPDTLPFDVDVGFIGESENTIVDIFNLIKNNEFNKENLKKIDGIAFFDGNKKLIINDKRRFIKDLDAYPFPARDVFSDDYWKTGVTSLLTSRGCPYHCAFCQVSKEWKICRYHSAKYIVEEIKELVNKYKIHTFGVIDDLFIANKSRIKEIIELLRKELLLGKIHFAVNGRANLMTEELVNLLKEMGVTEIAMGLESMSPKILSLIKDRATVEENKKAVDLVYNAGLKTGGLFMIGTPTETLEDMNMTYNYVKKNRHKFGGMQICITTPLPKTKLWDLCVEKKLIDPDINKFDWDKLNIAAEDVNSNLYVGDLDKEKFVKILNKFRTLFFNQEKKVLKEKKLNKLGKIKDYLKLLKNNTNYIEAGVNELKQVKSGNYSVELWHNGNIFWTNGNLNCILKSKGNEKKIIIEFQSGYKIDKRDLFIIELDLVDVKTQKILFKNKFEVAQSSWFKREFELPVMAKKTLSLTILSDKFSPKDLGMSVDSRVLGIAIKSIKLI